MSGGHHLSAHSRGALYLVAIMDWHSRYVVSWQLSNTLGAGFCVEALQGALGCGRPEIFKTDQASQFTSREFTQVLRDHEVKISIDGKGWYVDNIFSERLRRTVKYKEVYLKAYADAREARKELGAYFRFYNNRRPHQALGYRTPSEVYLKSHECSGGSVGGKEVFTGTGIGIIGRNSGTLA